MVIKPNSLDRWKWNGLNIEIQCDKMGNVFNSSFPDFTQEGGSVG